jgi:NAD+ diphosphatase
MTTPPPEAEGPALVVAVRGNEVHLADQEVTPGTAVTAPGGQPGLFLGTLDGRACWAVEVQPGEETDADAFFVDLRRLWGMVPELNWTLAGRAVQLVDWARTHRYCGRCGTRTELTEGERAMHCPACGLDAFPRLAPAVIVLVEREDGRALLARNVNFRMDMYSCLAGFVEPGENLEQAVRREVKEEVGVELADVNYWGSQPWPFPHSLMVGFHATYGGGDIVCAPDEIADAGWFAPEELPSVPSGISIARRLIDDWLRRRS